MKKCNNTHYFISYKFLSLIFLSLLIAIQPINTAIANELEIINLNYRPAKDILPILTPLLEKNGTISGEKYVLFIRTSAKNLSDLKKAIATLDADLRQLRISIMQESASNMKRHGFSVSSTSKKTNAIVYSTKEKTNKSNQQMIQVTEGQWATLQTGMSLPELTRTKNSNGTITESLEYKTIITRLKIQPILQGDNINVKVTSFTGKKNSHKSKTLQGLSTSVKGKVGQWIALGGITTPSSNQQSGYIFSTQHIAESNKQIFIKVEITQY